MSKQTPYELLAVSVELQWSIGHALIECKRTEERMQEGFGIEYPHCAKHKTPGVLFLPHHEKKSHDLEKSPGVQIALSGCPNPPCEKLNSVCSSVNHMASKQRRGREVQKNLLATKRHRKSLCAPTLVQELKISFWLKV